MAVPPAGSGSADAASKTLAAKLTTARAEQFSALASFTEAEAALVKAKAEMKTGWLGGAMKTPLIALTEASKAFDAAKNRLAAANKELEAAQAANRTPKGQAEAAAARDRKG